MIKVVSKDYSNYNDSLVTQSHELLKTGINPNNHDKAVELLLKIQTNYQPYDFVATEMPISSLYYKLIALIILIIVVTLIRPKTTIGLGKAKIEYTFYKIWIKFVIITIPAVCLIGPFWNKIIEWLY